MSGLTQRIKLRRDAWLVQSVGHVIASSQGPELESHMGVEIH